MFWLLSFTQIGKCYHLTRMWTMCATHYISMQLNWEQILINTPVWSFALQNCCFHYGNGKDHMYKSTILFLSCVDLFNVSLQCNHSLTRFIFSQPQQFAFSFAMWTDMLTLSVLFNWMLLIVSYIFQYLGLLFHVSLFDMLTFKCLHCLLIQI